jgi:hypothetical protein
VVLYLSADRWVVEKFQPYQRPHIPSHVLHPQFCLGVKKSREYIPVLKPCNFTWNKKFWEELIVVLCVCLMLWECVYRAVASSGSTIPTIPTYTAARLFYKPHFGLIPFLRTEKMAYEKALFSVHVPPPSITFEAYDITLLSVSPPPPNCFYLCSLCHIISKWAINYFQNSFSFSKMM